MNGENQGSGSLINPKTIFKKKISNNTSINKITDAAIKPKINPSPKALIINPKKTKSLKQTNPTINSIDSKSIGADSKKPSVDAESLSNMIGQFNSDLKETISQAQESIKPQLLNSQLMDFGLETMNAPPSTSLFESQSANTQPSSFNPTPITFPSQMSNAPASTSLFNLQPSNAQSSSFNSTPITFPSQMSNAPASTSIFGSQSTNAQPLSFNSTPMSFQSQTINNQDFSFNSTPITFSSQPSNTQPSTLLFGNTTNNQDFSFNSTTSGQPSSLFNFSSNEKKTAATTKKVKSSYQFKDSNEKSKYSELKKNREFNFKTAHTVLMFRHSKSNPFDYMVNRLLFERMKVFQSLKTKIQKLGIKLYDIMFRENYKKITDYTTDQYSDFFNYLESNNTVTVDSTKLTKIDENEICLKYGDILNKDKRRMINVVMKRKTILDYQNNDDLRKMKELYVFWESNKKALDFHDQWAKKIMNIVSMSKKYEPVNEWINSTCLQIINNYVQFCPLVYFSGIETKVNHSTKTVQLSCMVVEEMLGKTIDHKILKKNKDSSWDFEKKCQWMESLFFHLVFMLKMSQNVFRFVHFDLSPDSITYKKCSLPYDIKYQTHNDKKQPEIYSIKGQQYVFFIKDFSKSFIMLDEDVYTGTGLRSVKVKYETPKDMQTLYYVDMLMLVKKYLGFLDRIWMDQWIEESKTERGKKFIKTNLFCLIVKNLLSCNGKVDEELYPSNLLCSKSKKKWMQDNLGIHHPFSSFYSCMIDDKMEDPKEEFKSMEHSLDQSKSRPHPNFMGNHSIDISQSCQSSTVSQLIQEYFKKYKVNE